jgi:hypothetical protein
MAETAKKPDSSKKLFGLIGLLAFWVGIILSIVGGIWYQNSENIVLTLVIVGILVAVLNVTGKEVLPLLIAAIALIVVGLTSGFEPLNKFGGGAGDRLNEIVAYIAIFITPAAIISAIRAVWAVARPGD